MHSKLVGGVVACLCVVSAAAAAQQSASSGLVGQVTDSSQSAVPGATVTVTNVGTNAQRTTVTDGEGSALHRRATKADRSLCSSTRLQVSRAPPLT